MQRADATSASAITPAQIAAEATDWLDHPEILEGMRQELRGLRGEPGALASLARMVRDLLPPEMRRTISAPEYFHEVMEHRWALSDAAGHEVDIHDSARDYVANVLPHRPPDTL